MYGQFVSAAVLASATGPAGRSSPVLGWVVLVAVAVAAVGVFAVLQFLARSGRRSPVTGNRRPGETYDWRTLPPKDEGAPASVAEPDDYGPLWRYGVPLGYGRVYDPGHDRGYGSAPDLSQGPGYGPGHGRPGGIPDDTPGDGWS